jgi:O-methyltransferase involved in polyketide biosynthesis
VAEFDPKTPSIARVYDYWLGGKDNFAADRELAQQLLDISPPVALAARENKEFLSRAIPWLAGMRVGQFIDLGCGLPTAPSTHELARLEVPDARVAYLDTDPIVLSHLRGVPIREQAGLTIADGDVRDVAPVLDKIADGIDLSAPACLIMAALLHFFPADTARSLVARYVAALAPGSYLVLTMALASGPPAERFLARYNKGPNRLYQHSAADFASFFCDLPLLPPGVADARAWRPGWAKVPVPAEREVVTLVGVARIPLG